MKYLIKYSPEMTTKSRIVRSRFCKQLRKNIAKIFRYQLGLVDLAASKDKTAGVEVVANWDNLQVILSQEHASLALRVEEILRNTPGVWSFNRVLDYPLLDLDDALEKARAVYQERLEGKTFVVRCRRAGKHSFSSVDAERYIGGGLLEQTGARGVSLNAPDVIVAIEIKDEQLFIVDQLLPGLGGLPLGTQNPVLSLISGGFDSSVSTYMTMKRGLRSHFLFFNLGGDEHELAVKELSYYLWHKFGASHHVFFITVPFEAVVAEILERVDNAQMGVVLKRMMLRAASRVADILECEALVTGESVAQVSSQTLTNLSVIDEATDKLVLRPLIFSDKQDIVDISRRIGTEEFSAVIPEYCGVISVRPTTRAKRPRIVREEERFDFTVLDNAVANMVQLNITDLRDEPAKERVCVELVASPVAGDVIIDIRHPDEADAQPLTSDSVPVQCIPFYRLNARIAALSEEVRYLLYCDQGVMSRLHASHLLNQGKNNVAVYRP